MNLRIQGDDIPEPVLAVIGAITDRARLDFRRVEYDRANGVLRVPIQRLSVLPKRGLLARLRVAPLSWCQSTLIIRRIESCAITCNLNDDSLQAVTLLFGLGIRGREVFLSSAEESEGETCYSLDLQVAEVDIQIADEADCRRSDA